MAKSSRYLAARLEMIPLCPIRNDLSVPKWNRVRYENTRIALRAPSAAPKENDGLVAHGGFLSLTEAPKGVLLTPSLMLGKRPLRSRE